MFVYAVRVNGTANDRINCNMSMYTLLLVSRGYRPARHSRDSKIGSSSRDFHPGYPIQIC